MVSFPWTLVINILLAILFVIKIFLSAFKLFPQIRDYYLDPKQGLEIIKVDSSTSAGM